MAFGRRPFKKFRSQGFSNQGFSNQGFSSQGIHVKTLYNPFDTSNGQPKWPDGKATYSIGRRHQATSEITLDDYYVFLFPGAVNWCLACRRNGGDGTEVWANHSTNISFNYAFSVYPRLNPNDANDGISPDLKAVQWEVGLDGFVSWRPVSYAVHCQLLNTTDRNEGWYEAVRFNRNSLVFPWGILGGVGTPLGNGNYIKGTPHFHNGGICPNAQNLIQTENNAWDDHPSYITGELQDIHNAVFQLNHIKQDNDFQRIMPIKFPMNGWTFDTILHQRDDVINAGEMEVYTPRIEVSPGDQHMAAEDVPTKDDISPLMSDAMDCIAIHIHATTGTKLLLHSVANQEFLCAENSQMSQYATSSECTPRELDSFMYLRNARYKYPFHYLSSGGHLSVPRPPYS